MKSLRDSFDSIFKVVVGDYKEQFKSFHGVRLDAMYISFYIRDQFDHPTIRSIHEITKA